jgi:hypothetical protein
MWEFILIKDKVHVCILHASEGEHAAQGKALVIWKTVCKPNFFGGLGMPDIERSRSALRLRWPCP